jgi:hypothetical protein
MPMRYHEGPFLNGSPSDLAGLIMVIAFFFFPFFVTKNELAPYMFCLFIAVEIVAIGRWLYVDSKDEDSSLRVFPPDDIALDTTARSSSHRFPAIMKQLAMVAAAILTTIAMFLTITSDSAFIHWLIFGVVAAIAGYYVFTILLKRRNED